MGSVTQLVTPTLPEVAGYVEALTAESVVGWAWSPRAADQRASVELRLGEAVLAQAAADQLRADLAANGIGDGKHAFALAIPKPYLARASELAVYARVGEGPAFPIGAPPLPETVSDHLQTLRKGIEILVSSQRGLHRMMQTAVAREAASDLPNLAVFLERQSELCQQVAAIERFIVRLDAHLAADAPDKPGRSVPPAALWALGVAGVSFVVSIVGLVHSLGG